MIARSSACGVQRTVRTFLSVAAVTVAFASLAVAAESVKVDVEFSGLWWTEEQLIKFGNADQSVMPPPPKETRTVIKEWYWGDTMPPHPDVVDVDVTVASNSAFKESVEVSYQYKVKGRLTAPAPLIRRVLDLAPGASEVLHGSIHLQEYVDNVQHPTSVRVITRIGKRPPTIATLPVVIGD